MCVLINITVYSKKNWDVYPTLVVCLVSIGKIVIYKPNDKICIN